MEELKAYLKDLEINILDITDILTVENTKKIFLYDDSVAIFKPEFLQLPIHMDGKTCLIIDIKRLQNQVKKLLINPNDHEFTLIKADEIHNLSISDNTTWKKSVSKWLLEKTNCQCPICENSRTNFYVCGICCQSICTDCWRKIESVNLVCPYCRTKVRF